MYSRPLMQGRENNGIQQTVDVMPYTDITNLLTSIHIYILTCIYTYMEKSETLFLNYQKQMEQEQKQKQKLKQE